MYRIYIYRGFVHILIDEISLTAPLTRNFFFFFFFPSCVAASSPVPEGTAALYRFEGPAVAQVVLPPSGNFSPGDIQLNMNNSIVELDGSEILYGCNGDVVSGSGVY